MIKRRWFSIAIKKKKEKKRERKKEVYISRKKESWRISKFSNWLVRVNEGNRIIEWLLAQCNYSAIAQPDGKNPFPEGSGQQAFPRWSFSIMVCTCSVELLRLFLTWKTLKLSFSIALQNHVYHALKNLKEWNLCHVNIKLIIVNERKIKKVYFEVCLKYSNVYYKLYSYPNIWLMKISNDRFKGSNIPFNCQALPYTNALEKARKKEDS